jgi:hypothetical protein
VLALVLLAVFYIGFGFRALVGGFWRLYGHKKRKSPFSRAFSGVYLLACFNMGYSARAQTRDIIGALSMVAMARKKTSTETVANINFFIAV